MDTVLSAEVHAQIQAHILAHQHVPGGLMPLLHAIQDDIGYVPEVIYPDIAHALALSVAEVHGVVTFYHHFRTHPVGKHILQVCRAESCQAMGSGQLESELKAQLGVDYHQTTADGQLTLLPVYCLGNCGCSPAVMLDEAVYGRMSTAKVSALIAEVCHG